MSSRRDSESDDEEESRQNEEGTSDPISERGPNSGPAQPQPQPPQPQQQVPRDPILQQMFQSMMMMQNQQDMGNYVSDDRLEEVINQLMIANPGPKGNPPAAPYHVQQLDEITVDKKNRDKIGKCAVCSDEFELYSEALRMPCKHYFHHDCIHPWLKMHNTCPLCRHELPTLDIEYEERKFIQRRDDDYYESRSDGRSSGSDYMYL